jgi:hypothetical protein
VAAPSTEISHTHDTEPELFLQQMLLLYGSEMHTLRVPSIYRISRPIRHTVIFSLEIIEKNNDECILILVIYWKK